MVNTFLAAKGIIAGLIIFVLTLWVARRIYVCQRGISVFGSVYLSFLLLFEPAVLAFCLWALHNEALLQSKLMLLAYTLLKAGGVVYLIFILPEIVFTWRFIQAPSPNTFKALRFGIVLLIAFATVMFWEIPRMIWPDTYEMLSDVSMPMFIGTVAVNLVLLGLTFVMSRKPKA